MYEEIDYNKFYRLIGDNIKKIRMDHNDSQEVLAEKCNVSAKYISALETRSFFRKYSSYY